MRKNALNEAVDFLIKTNKNAEKGELALNHNFCYNLDAKQE